MSKFVFNFRRNGLGGVPIGSVTITYNSTSKAITAASGKILGETVSFMATNDPAKVMFGSPDNTFDKSTPGYFTLNGFNLKNGDGSRQFSIYYDDANRVLFVTAAFATSDTTFCDTLAAPPYNSSETYTNPVDSSYPNTLYADIEIVEDNIDLKFPSITYNFNRAGVGGVPLGSLLIVYSGTTIKDVRGTILGESAIFMGGLDEGNIININPDNYINVNQQGYFSVNGFVLQGYSGKHQFCINWDPTSSQAYLSIAYSKTDTAYGTSLAQYNPSSQYTYSPYPTIPTPKYDNNWHVDIPITPWVVTGAPLDPITWVSSLNATVLAVQNANALVDDATNLIAGAVPQPSTNPAAILLAASRKPDLYSTLGAGLTTFSTNTSDALAVALKAKCNTSGDIATPINLAVPSPSKQLPVPSGAGSYFIAVDRTVSATYTFTGSTDRLEVDGATGTQTMLYGTTRQVLSLGSRYTITSNGTTYNLIVNYQGSQAASFTTSGVACFLADAPVLTPAGYRRIASLRNGDLVITATGAAVPIQAVTARPVAASTAVNPYVIPKGRFGALRDLAISPDHKVAVGDGMIPAVALGLRQKDMTGDFMYYNLELPDHENMVVAGVTVESQYPVKRITVTMAEFRKILVAQYGNLTPAILAAAQKKVRFLADGRVVVPVDKRRVA